MVEDPELRFATASGNPGAVFTVAGWDERDGDLVPKLVQVVIVEEDTPFAGKPSGEIAFYGSFGEAEANA